MEKTLESLEKKFHNFANPLLAEIERSLPSSGVAGRAEFRNKAQDLINSAQTLVAELKVKQTAKGMKDLETLVEGLVEAFYMVSMDNAGKWRVIMGWDTIAGEA